MTKQKKVSEGTHYWPLILLLVGVVGLFAFSWWWITTHIVCPEQRGQFGDQFGAISALFSGLAFAGLIFTIILQKKELTLQREELIATKKELEGQKEQLEIQNTTLNVQRFENLFYNMLNLQQTIVEGLRYEYYDEERVTVPLDKGYSTNKRHIQREVKGRDVFRYLFEDVELLVEGISKWNAVKGYRRFLHVKGFEKYDTTLVPSYFDHYFRHLYKIVQFVDKQQFEFEEKYKYISFLRGTLSRYELVWLYYNALNSDFHKFKELIERYTLLKALRCDLLTLSKETAVYYEGLGVTKEELKEKDFNIGDFEFFLTDKSNEGGKYNVSAFWSITDLPYGNNRLAKWRTFIDEKAEAIIKEI